MLLGAVVDVALQASALLVLRGDDPLPRGAQLGRLPRDLVEARLEVGGEPDVREHEAGLLGELGRGACLGRARAARSRASSTAIAPSSSPW